MAATGNGLDARATRDAWVDRRKRRYMAQILECFEQDIEPLIRGGEGTIQNFKGLVRQRLNALATDAKELMALEDEAQASNFLAQEFRDALHPTGRP